MIGESMEESANHALKIAKDIGADAESRTSQLRIGFQGSRELQNH